jgi:anti-sigma regulatory factor (Ser/Thr protein kinase)
MTTNPPTRPGTGRTRPPSDPPWWTRRDNLELGAYPQAVPVARLHARQIIWEWGLIRFTDEAEAVITELVANGVQATRIAGLDTPVRLALFADDDRILVVVWDGSPEIPAPTAATDDESSPSFLDEGGRGLMLVGALSAWWDWHQDAQGGKVVRALIGAS